MIARNDYSGRTSSYAYDEFWHLTEIVDQELYEDVGEIAWAADFSAYGLTAHQFANEIDIPSRFPGKYFDRETGLHYNRHRYYDPQYGRFIPKDPIGLIGDANFMPM